MDFGVVVLSVERLGGGIGFAKIGDRAPLAGEGGSPPARRIDALRKMQGMGVGEASDSQVPVQRHEDGVEMEQRLSLIHI